MVSDSENPAKSMVATLVFVDLEATGLPSLVGPRNVQITEISLIAVDRREFETDGCLRVLNKLSLCIKPKVPISPGAMDITGLYNDNLEQQKKFDETIPKILEFFFRRLNRPICLLAHNGKRYDFPLLKAELQNIEYGFDAEILCADTLEAFKFIVANSRTNGTSNDNTNILLPHVSDSTRCKSTNIILSSVGKSCISSEILNSDKRNMSTETSFIQSKPVTERKKEGVLPYCAPVQENCLNVPSVKGIVSTDVDDEINALLNEDLELFDNIVEPMETNSTFYPKQVQKNPNERMVSISVPYQVDEGEKARYVGTPHHHFMKSKFGSANKLVEENITPSSKTRLNMYLNENCHPTKVAESDSMFGTVKKSVDYNRTVPAKRQLFAADGNNPEQSPKKKIMSMSKPAGFALNKLYYHYFGEDPPVSHYAEADCTALMKVCQKKSEEFLMWVDQNSKSFNDSVKSMW